ncbi:MAG: hypothetical protein DRN04_10905 [Thermoprotei archaeon]|nr:MAG: hypothetical protein DRN04_10905 [Thermoprotei archaeon]
MPRVERYSFREIVIDGKLYTKDLIITPTRIKLNWWTPSFGSRPAGLSLPAWGSGKLPLCGASGVSPFRVKSI